MKAIRNIDELRDFTIECLIDLRSGRITTLEANSLSRQLDRVIGCEKVKMEYQRLTGDVYDIPFFGDMKKGKLLRRIPEKNSAMNSARKTKSKTG